MLLRHGMRNQNVETLQYLLGNLGYMRAAPSGLYGDATKLAVVAFQRDNNLSPDGVVGEKTLAALYEADAELARGIEGGLPDRTQMDCDSIIADKTGIEAGWVNNPDDRGGETKHGVTKRVADDHKDALVSLFGWDGEMRNLTKQMARYVYIEDYWDKMLLTEVCRIDPYIADKMFDIGINAGVYTASRWLQILICVMNKKGRLYDDVEIDGHVGAKTVDGLKAAFRAHGNRKAGWAMMKGLLSKQGDHYIDISLNREANETFFMGWMNRLDHNFKVYQTFYTGR